MSAPLEPSVELPVSHAQERLWFLDQLSPGDPGYVLSWTLGLEGEVDESALRDALESIVVRHETLRTTFSSVDGRPVQRVSEEIRLPFEVIDLGPMAPGEQESRLAAIIGEDSERGFDLSRGPLLRVQLVHLGPQRHVMLLSMHHIVSDGWSIGIFLHELAALYDAFREGRPSPLSDLEIQYADFAEWQRERLQGPVLDTELAYWRKTLEGVPPRLELPTDHARNGASRGRGAVHSFVVPAGASARLKELARRAGVTPFMVLLAGFQALLHRYSGQDDFVVGSPIAGRNRSETESLIGFFVNMLPLRADLSGKPSFSELLRRVRDVTLGAYAHQDLPFEKLVNELQPERRLDRSPVYQVVFTLQNTPRQALELQGLRVTALPREITSTRFDLEMHVQELGDTFVGLLCYDCDLYEAEFIQRLGKHYCSLLSGAVAEPDRPLSDLPILGEDETRRLLVEWNATAAPYPAERCVHEQFSDQARRTPEAVAVVLGRESWTYAQLEARSTRIARCLRRRGVGPEVSVGMFVERSFDLVAGLLGILKAGGAYLPLDPEYPRERLDFMLASSAVALILTQESLAGRLVEGAAPKLLLDAESAEIAAESAEPFEGGATPDNLAYVIYTSGSTGSPKGALLPHRGLSNVVEAQRRCFGISADGAVLQFSSPSFDASVFEILLALGAGARLCLAPTSSLLLGPPLGHLLEEEQISIVTLPPSALALLPATGLPKLEVVTVAGEACPAELVRRWAPGREFFNLYGPTEATIWSTYASCVETDGPPPIGRPIQNARAYVLDSAGQLVPQGVAGELYVAGAGLARGYLKRPGLTAERFVPDPFSPEPGGRLYRTGDLVRWRSDGNLEFLGRVDRQVKLRGFRIELGEIESALAGHEEVAEAAVLVREDEPDRRHLVAYVARTAGSEVGASALRQHLGRSLPSHMVPGPFVFLESLPLSPNGKVDRRALPVPDPTDRETLYEAPTTETQAALARIWSEVLGVERVGIHDNFFDLGGDSILSLQIVSRANAAGVPLGLKQLFEHQTIRELAEKLAAAGAEPVEAKPIPRVGRGGDLALSFAQERLWLVDRLHPGSSAYTLFGALELAGCLSVPALEKSLREVARRHETLRTVVAEVGGRPVQRIEEASSLTLERVPLDGATEAERETRARQVAEEEARAPFELGSGPLFRARLLRVADERQILLLRLHHIVADGWSLNVLARELGVLYAAFSEGRPSPLPELPVQYADYAAWQRDRLGHGALAGQLDYWRRRLERLEALDLPTDRPRPAAQTFAGASESTWLSEEVTSRVRTLCQRLGVTTFMVLLTGFKALLHRYTGQADITIGTPIVNRDRPETEGLIGLFLNALVLRTDVGGDPTFRGLLERVRETAVGAYAHPDVPFEQLVQELRPERDLSRTPLFQVLFNMLSFDLKPLELPGLSLRPFAVKSATAKHDLTVHALEAEGRIGLTLGYNSDLFEADTVRSLLAGYESLLTGASEDVEQRLSVLPLTRAAERRRPDPSAPRVRVPGEATDFESRDVEQSVSRRFEQQVRRRADRIAVATASVEWGYAELNRVANRIAHALRERAGGEPGRVGVLLEPDAPLMASLLGVLKSGGTFVPLDPRYPRPRLRAMIQDAEPGAVLVDHENRGLAHELAGPGVAVEVEALTVAGSDEDPRWTTEPDQLAYILYTSGSTGRPKGVTQTHRNLLHHIRCYSNALRISARDRVTLLASVSFDAALMDIFGALLNGATLLPFDTRAEGVERRLIESLVERNATIYHSTPTLFRHVLRSAERREVLDGVRAVVLGGEAAMRRDVELFKEHFAAGSVLLNNMGPTESSVTLHYLLDHETALERERVPIGDPVAETEVVLLDAAGRRTDLYGELAIRSRYVTPGYWRDPQLTREAFVAVPGEAGDPFYRTGDFGRRLPDGSIDYLGRRDAQVKVRGFRVELGDIEATLLQHPGVSEAAARTWEGPDGDPILAAYFVADPRPGPSDRELRRFLMERLPDYMVPGSLAELDALPLTPTLKIDRRALPAPAAASRGDEGYVAPRSPLEESLSSIWREVLKIDRVGAHDNFFELGGNSLLATQVISRVRQDLGVELSLRSMFETAALADLAGVVQKERGRGARRPAITRIERGSARAAVRDQGMGDVGE